MLQALAACIVLPLVAHHAAIIATNHQNQKVSTMSKKKLNPAKELPGIVNTAVSDYLGDRRLSMNQHEQLQRLSEWYADKVHGIVITKRAVPE